MTGRRLVLCFVLILSLRPCASAATTPVVVQLSPNASLPAVLSALGGTLIDTIPDLNSYLVNAANIPPQSLYATLGIDSLEINGRITLSSARQFGVLRVQAAAPADWYKNQPLLGLVHSQDALTYAQGQGVIVADLNSIVDYSHPALAGHLTAGYDFVNDKPSGETSLNQSSSEFLDQSSSEFLDQSSSEFLDQSSSEFLDNSSFATLNPAYSHGTLCAGIISVMAPNAMIMPLRVFDDDGVSDVHMIAKAIRYAVKHGAQIINMSFGTLTDAPVLRNAVDFASRNNVIVVASAGNNGVPFGQYPAAYSGVIAVSATDIGDVKASFSNYGSYIAVDAPGVNVISAFPGGLYSIVSGTSFSAPMVASEMALMRSIQPSGAQAAVLAGTVNIDAQNPNYVGKLGVGRIDALKAVRP